MSGFEAVALAAAAVSAYAAVQQGEAAKKAADYNAQVASMQATQARDVAASQEGDQAFKSMQLLGAQKAAAAASGVDPNSGSPLDIFTNTAARSTLDALRIRWKGEADATGDLNQAQLDRFEGSNAQTAGYLKAGATLLDGASYAFNPRYGGQGKIGGQGADGGFGPG